MEPCQCFGLLLTKPRLSMNYIGSWIPMRFSVLPNRVRIMQEYKDQPSSHLGNGEVESITPVSKCRGFRGCLCQV